MWSSDWFGGRGGGSSRAINKLSLSVSVPLTRGRTSDRPIPKTFFSRSGRFAETGETMQKKSEQRSPIREKPSDNYL